MQTTRKQKSLSYSGYYDFTTMKSSIKDLNMKHKDSFTDYLKTFSGNFIPTKITTKTLYTAYTKYCEKKKITPDTYDELSTRLQVVIFNLDIMWCSMGHGNTNTLTYRENTDEQHTKKNHNTI